MEHCGNEPVRLRDESVLHRRCLEIATPWSQRKQKSKRDVCSLHHLPAPPMRPNYCSRRNTKCVQPNLGEHRPLRNSFIPTTTFILSDDDGVTIVKTATATTAMVWTRQLMNSECVQKTTTSTATATTASSRGLLFNYSSRGR